MNDFLTTTLGRFDSYCIELNIGSSTAHMARLFVKQEVEDFLSQERSYGLGKTRRPSFGHRLFAEQINRAKELERREEEELKWMTGDHD